MLNGDGVLSPEELWTLFMAICSAIITISAAITIIINAVKKMKEPENVQNEKLEELKTKIVSIEAVLNVYEGYFSKDNRRISVIEEGNRVTQKAILALMSHAINGNDVDKLKEAESDLREYLINKS